MSFDFNAVDPERLKLQLESAVQSHEFTLVGLEIDRQVTLETLETLEDAGVDEHHRHSLSHIELEIKFYSKKLEIAKRKLEEFLSQN